MSRVAQIIWTSIGVGMTAMLFVAAIVSGYLMTPADSPCRSLEFVIKDGDERMYLSESELIQLLKDENIYPVGVALNHASLHRIESAVRRHPMVRTAECYATPDQDVKVELTQRVPLLRVQAPAETYFIDTDRRQMPARNVVKDSVLVVTGTVGVQTAATQLADFAEWLQENKYWRNRIHHVHMRTPQMMVLYLRGEEQPRVVMGSIYRYKAKLAKLRVFFENGAEAVGENKYTELDVRYRGQVIGRKQ
mgnify:CR=1 FL=1